MEADIDAPMPANAPDKAEEQLQESPSKSSLRRQNSSSRIRKGRSSASALVQSNMQRSVVARIYLHPAFETVTMLLIIVNSLWIGFELDYKATYSPKVFDFGEIIFSVLFSLELLIRFFAYPKKVLFFTEPVHWRWNVFDLILVFMMNLECWVLGYILRLNMDQLAMFSTLRLLRLLRMTRLFRIIPELGMMVKSLIAALRSVSSTCILAVGIMYIFAIVLTQWVRSYPENKCFITGDGGAPTLRTGPACDGVQDGEQCLCLQDYFGTLTKTFLALTQILVFDDTFEIVRPVLTERIAYGLLLLLYMFLVSFTVLNMLIGVICDIVSDTTANEKRKILRQRVADLFEEVDTDGSGTLTRQEFDHSGAKTALEQIGIDGPVLTNAFEILDTNNDNQIELGEFTEMIFKCLQAPQAQDILHIQNKIDAIAEHVGIGRESTAVLQKDRRRRSNYSRMPTSGLGFLTSVQGDPTCSASSRPALPMPNQLDAPESQGASKRTGIDQGEEAGDVQDTNLDRACSQMEAIGRHVSQLQLLAHAAARKRAASEGHGLAHSASGAQNGCQPLHHREGMSRESTTPRTIGRESTGPETPGTAAGPFAALGAALHTLNARLFALRAEFKVAAMQQSGGVQGETGPSQKPSLDDMITEVIEQIIGTRDTLCRGHLLSSRNASRMQDDSISGFFNKEAACV